ncbi:MAG: hypothetical protein QXK37_03640 [Candidatus Woesearchaeota archaeon]
MGGSLRYRVLLISTQLILAILAPIVTADFSVYTSPDFRLCRGSIGTDILTIINNGQSPRLFSFDAGPTATFTENNILIDAGESRDIVYFINPPKTTSSISSYKLSINVYDDSSAMKQLTKLVKIDDCVNVAVRIENNAFKSCPCTPIQYKFTVSNIGDFAETFDMHVNTDSGIYIIDQNPIYIPAKEERIVSVFLNPPCYTTGEKEYLFTVKARTSEYIVQTPFYHKIDDSCFDYDVNISRFSYILYNGTKHNYSMQNQSYLVCRNTISYIPIKIKNKAAFPNLFYYSVDGPDWVLFAQNQTLLSERGKTEDTAEFEIVLLPSDLGRSELMFHVAQDRGKLTKSAVINLDVVDCFIPYPYSSISDKNRSVSPSYNISSGIILPNVSFNISSNTSYNNLTYFNVSSNNGSYINRTSNLTETSEQRTTTPFKLSPFWVLFSILLVILIALLVIFLHGRRAAKEFEQSEDASHAVENNLTYSKKETFRKEAKRHEVKKEKSRETISSSNEQEPSPWRMFLWLLLIVFLVVLFILMPYYIKYSREKADSRDVTVSVEPNTTFSAHGMAGFLSNDSTNRNLSNMSLYNMSNPVYYFSDVQNLSAGNEGWSLAEQNIVLLGGKIKLLWLLFVLLILLLLSLLFIFYLKRGSRLEDSKSLKVVDLKKIKREEKSKESRRFSHFFVVFFIIVVFLLVLVFFFTGLHKQFGITFVSNNQTENATFIPPEVKTVFEWEENKDYVIDLSYYAYDADEDFLIFRATPVENISVSINRSIVTLHPDKDFVGQRVINFIAEDGLGGRAYSPDILLVVKEVEPLPLRVLKWLKSSLFSWLNIAIISAVLLVVIITLLIMNIQKSSRYKAIIIKRRRKL